MPDHCERRNLRAGRAPLVAVIAVLALAGCAALPAGDPDERFGSLRGGEPPGDPHARDARPGLFTGEGGEFVIFER